MLAVSGPGLLLPLLALAAVLAVSGVAKARDRHTAADGFRALGLPDWTVRLPGPEALAALEICLATALLTSSGGLLEVAAVLACGLCAAYLVIVLRAVRTGAAVRCRCFGRFLDHEVSGWSVTRNVCLLGCAALSWYAASTGAAVPSLVAAADARDWTGLAGAGLVLLLVVSLLAPGARRPTTADATPPDTPSGSRQAIPYAVLIDPEGGRILLREWASRGRRLLIYVSPACAPCQRTLALTPGWAQQLAPTVSVYVVQRLDGAERAAPGTLADPHGHLAEALELPATPAAVLLGTDGRLDGGPVSGEMRVSSFVADLLPGLPES